MLLLAVASGNFPISSVGRALGHSQTEGPSFESLQWRVIYLLPLFVCLFVYLFIN